jgi:hypothetical protein
MTRADRVLVAVLACAALLATPVAIARDDDPEGGVHALVTAPGGTRCLSLEHDGSYAVQGLRGRVVVVVEAGSVRVSESACRDQVCVHAGPVSLPGAAIACIPNGVSVTVEGGARELDSIVR